MIDLDSIDDYGALNYGQLGDIAVEIANAGDRQAAATFLQRYRAYCMGTGNPASNADTNIGYLSGYYDPETAAKIRDVFDVSHPVFGRTTPTPDEAFAAGQQMGRGMKA